ncbi:hypothetical protein LEMLEM_LOCUS8609 [Lemmus lemmus]
MSISFDSQDLKMAAQSEQKLVLKGTTKLSLNERFTSVLNNKQPIPVTIWASMQQQQLAVPEAEDLSSRWRTDPLSRQHSILSSAWVGRVTSRRV